MKVRRASLIAVIGVAAVVFLFLNKDAVSQTPNQQELIKLIPSSASNTSPSQSDVHFYGPDNLYQYMDGGADIFVLYGIRALMHKDFHVKEVDLTLDVFDMGSPDTAFGMYAAERSPDYRYLTIGAEGYRDEGILNFVQDRYYIKLAGFGENADAVLAELAHQISAKIGVNPQPPLLLAQLPLEKRKPHSEQYMPKDPLGHSFLSPAYVVTYKYGEHDSKLYVTAALDEKDAQQKMKQLEEHFQKSGEYKAAPEIGPHAIQATNSFEGKVLAETKGRYLLLLLDPTSEGPQLLKSSAESLK